MMTARDTEEEDDQAAGCVRDREDAKGGGVLCKAFGKHDIRQISPPQLSQAFKVLKDERSSYLVVAGSWWYSWGVVSSIG